MDVESNYSGANDPNAPLNDVPILTQMRSNNGVSLSREDHKTISRRNSVSLVHGPTKVAPGVKLPAEFRTLRFVLTTCFPRCAGSEFFDSIHVTDTKEGRFGGKKGKKDVTGMLVLSISVSRR